MLDNFVLQALLATANETCSPKNTSITHADVVEILLPLVGLRTFAPLVKYLDNQLGLGLAYLFIFLCFLWASNRVLYPIYEAFHWLITNHFMSTVVIYEKDALYNRVMEWLATVPSMVNSRNLMAKTRNSHELDHEVESSVVHDHSGVYLNFSRQDVRVPPRYFPAMGSHSLWWKGQFFRIRRVRDKNPSLGPPRQELAISYFGWSPKPIKQLLAHAKTQLASGQSNIAVNRPDLTQLRYGAADSAWMKVVDRPVRDIGTVIMDDQQKKNILDDVNDYLHPNTALWYANLGIPLRRGYIFYGPPGTGKSSLACALARFFGLDIFVISLQDPSMTEGNLSMLFNALPRRSVLLLEDIDAAGIGRPRDAPGGDAGEKAGISLSGLLNAIDGVSSPEGRVLIMTTNRLDAIDKALIRPGRADLQIAFRNADKKQAADLFIQIYKNGNENDNDNKAANQRRTADTDNVGGAPDTATEQGLVTAAEQFAARIPDGEFSPAEVQGFLLPRKKEPGRALAEADEWIAALRRRKAAGSNVLEKQ